MTARSSSSRWCKSFEAEQVLQLDRVFRMGGKRQSERASRDRFDRLVDGVGHARKLAGAFSVTRPDGAEKIARRKGRRALPLTERRRPISGFSAALLDKEVSWVDGE